MAGWAVLCWLLITPPAAAGLLPACPSDAVRGRTRFSDPNCAWNTPQLPPNPSSLQLLGTCTLAGGGVFPAITVGASNSSAAEQAVPGFTLTIKRLLLRNVTLAAATDTSTPTFAPLGLFSGVPEELSMMDVRLAVNSKDFQDYLAFFSKHLRAIRTKDDGGVGMHTDGSSFLNVPYWSDNHTELYPVTMLTGPCNPAVGHVAFSGVQTNLPGCNIRTVNNKTLVQTLQRDATINTTEPLLVRITSNVTLGPGLEGPIVVQRPVLLLGTSSAPISVDMGMMVNHLHVLAPTAQLAWQALVLENLAPGDPVSAIMAPPYSTTVTTNLWAVYCNRSQDMCVPVTNVTLVIPSQEEIDYLEFMATMYNSPSQALRSLASFYSTDLKMTKFEFLPDTTNTMTVLHLVANSWHFWYLVLTTKPMFAPPRPVPRQLFDQLRYKTGVLVQSIKGCAGFQATQAFAANRVHVWQLMANVSIGEDACSWPVVNITGPTTLLGEVASASNTPMSMRSYPLSAAVPGGPVLPTNGSVQHVTDGHTSQAPTVAAQLSDSTMYTLSFNYTPDLFLIPPEAPERYLQVRNITLRQLPQLQRPSNSSNDSSSARRLLQSGGVAALPFTTDPGVWTILLWSFNRSLSGTPLVVAESRIMLPRPEWEVFAKAVKASRHFAILLQGSFELLFAGVTTMEGEVFRVVSFKGPGIEGSNLDLLPDADEAAAIPGYIWPASVAATPAPPQGASSLQQGLPVAAQAALGAVLGALGLLAAGAAVLLVWRHCRRRQQSQRQAAIAPGKPAAVAPLKCVALAAANDGTDNAAAPDQGRHAATVQAAFAVAAANGDLSKQQGPFDASISNSSQPLGDPLPASSLSEPLPAIQVSSLDATQTSSTSSQPPSGDVSGKPCAAQSSGAEVAQSIAQGLRHWHDAVSLQTMRLMQQRQEASCSYHRQLTPSTSDSSSTLHLPYSVGQDADTGHASSVAAAAGGSSYVSSSRSSEELQLFEVIGTGSFGVVHLGSWRGKKVAVKVMQLTAHAFSSPPTPAALQQQREGGQPQQQRVPGVYQENSRPHMAIMEAVLSTNLHHPNLVHVFTYMLRPLTTQACSGGNSSSYQQDALAGPAAASKRPGPVSGWELQLVMEMCEKGTLREALDYGLLPYLPPTKLLHPAIVAALAHDVAAAMLHLHSEGVVHGDLKAGNVLLQANTDVSSATNGDFGQDVLEVWMAAGCVPLTGKVADFGMSLPIGGETHATMAARGTPTHISPELFTSGHISKASDVYAYGILLYEVLTGHRAYAGVPIPLLPHEVAVQGLRPTWPPGMPAAYSALRALAEACWEHQPQHRPTFQAVLVTLEAIQSQQRPEAAASPADVPACGTYRAPAAAAAVMEGA